ncbi:MAG: DMT family transporter, partial [Clostridia bacterium]|nr:DMT family transporter [Clostridia bacterium]
MQMNKMVKGYLLTIASAMMFGFVPAAAKLAYANGLNSISLVFYRNLFAAFMLGVLIKAKGERLVVESKSDLKKALLLGLFCTTITPLLLFVSYSFIPSSVASTFHFTYPAITILATALVVKKPVQKGHIFCVALCMLGIIMFCTPGVKLNVLGAGSALLSGFTFATYIVLLDLFHMSAVSSQKLTFYMASEASVILLIVCFATGNFMPLRSFPAVGCCVLVAFLSTVGATVLFQKGTLLIGGPRSSILSTFEPITSIV